ncbi:MAG: DUF1731 domain-containing protein [Myxococcota bacterium]
MKCVLAGGSGQVGGILVRDLFRDRDDLELVVLTRTPGAREDRAREVAWDGRTAGAWCDEVATADVVINLAGRTVNCRYTEENLRQMMDSRVLSTRAVGDAIAAAPDPPRVWLQMSTATIYAHRFDAANDEATGIIGGDEPDTPAYWARSVDIAKNWEAELERAVTPKTRQVALRSAIVLSPDREGIFDVLMGLTRFGLGGAIAGGRQYVSWIHEADFVAACEMLIERDDLRGAFNLSSPHPLPQRAFMAALREAAKVPFGLPATAWMVHIGAFFLRTDAELVLKSRRVVPARLMEAGLRFAFADWPEAATDLCARWPR